MKSILAIVVLYRMTLEESPTLRAMRQIFTQKPDSAEAIDLLVADNSPDRQEPPSGFSGTYLHDGTNPGLAVRYNQALALAAQTGAQWLLLFDQDTHLTEDFFDEVLALSAGLAAADTGPSIIVPKLVMGDTILSPHTPVFRKRRFTVEPTTTGLLPSYACAFNSGALIRVSALQAIGGFPVDYWLDYLDHATFARIQAAGGRVYVLNAMLQHDLSDAVPDNPVKFARMVNRLRAEERFYAEYGSRSERLRHRLDLIRQVIGLGRRGNFAKANLRLKILFRLN